MKIKKCHAGKCPMLEEENFKENYGDIDPAVLHFVEILFVFNRTRQ